MPQIRSTNETYSALAGRSCRLLVLSLIFSILVALTFRASHAQAPLDIVGQIAYIGADHNVHVIDSAGRPVALSRDGSAAHRYQFPMWATDGRLAFFCCDANFSSQMIRQVYIASPDMTAAKLLSTSLDEAYTYASWSPAACAETPSCHDMALLVARRGDSFRLDLIRVNAAAVTSRTVGTGAPYYLSWKRDGQRMLWYRNNDEIALYDLESAATEVYPSAVPGGMQAPSWSPADDRAVVVLRDQPDTNAIVTLEDGEQHRLFGGIPAEFRGSPNLTSLGWSDDGRYIAYRLINRFGASPLFVLDSVSGATVAATQETNIVAFFWSPDSRHILFLTPSSVGDANIRTVRVSSQADTPLFTWSILDIDSGRIRKLTSFAPTASMLYLFAFFDQFSQSHRIWSPDSRHIVYAETVDGGESLVKILDITTDIPVPFTIAEGDIGIWSYQ